MVDAGVGSGEADDVVADMVLPLGRDGYRRNSRRWSEPLLSTYSCLFPNSAPCIRVSVDQQERSYRRMKRSR